MIFPTGGATGLLKGCYTSHRELLLWSWNVSASTLSHRFEVELYGAVLCVSLVVGTLAPLFAGCTVVIEPMSSASSALEAIGRHSVTDSTLVVTEHPVPGGRQVRSDIVPAVWRTSEFVQEHDGGPGSPSTA